MKQYYHQRYENKYNQEFTAVVDVPDKATLLFGLVASFGEKVLFQIPVGLTLVHSKEMYCKSLGRHHAQKNISTQTFEIKTIWPEKDKVFIVLKNTNKEHPINEIKLQIKHKRDRVYLMDVCRSIWYNIGSSLTGLLKEKYNDGE